MNHSLWLEQSSAATFIGNEHFQIHQRDDGIVFQIAGTRTLSQSSCIDTVQGAKSKIRMTLNINLEPSLWQGERHSECAARLL